MTATIEVQPPTEFLRANKRKLAPLVTIPVPRPAAQEAPGRVRKVRTVQPQVKSLPGDAVEPGPPATASDPKHLPLRLRRPFRIITEDDLERLGELFAKGVPVKYALKHLRIDMLEQSFFGQLERHPHLKAIYESSVADRLVWGCEQIYGATSAKDLPVGICWMHERRMPDLFGKKPETVASLTQNFALIPNELWTTAQRLLLSQNDRNKVLTSVNPEKSSAV